MEHNRIKNTQLAGGNQMASYRHELGTIKQFQLWSKWDSVGMKIYMHVSHQHCPYSNNHGGWACHTF